MANRTPVLSFALLFSILLVTSDAQQAPAGAGAAAAAAAGGAAGMAGGVGGAAAAAANAANMRATRAKHVFCNSPPMARAPKIPIFHMEVNTGFYNGYRSNQTVVVNISSKYPEVWRINQFFVHVPDNDPYVYSGRRTVGFVRPKEVGHWMWNLRKGANADPTMGGSQPVDCGGMSSFGYGMLSPMGAHAAKEVPPVNNDPADPHKGWASVEAKWVPPTNWENIMKRKMITITAYVTFEKTPPGTGHSYNPYSYHQQHRHGYTQPARWVKKTTSLLNLDYIDIHNYLIVHFGPMYQQYFEFGGSQQHAMTPAVPKEL